MYFYNFVEYGELNNLKDKIMKKTNLLKATLAAAVLSLSACNNEEVLTQEGEIQLTSKIAESRVTDSNLQSTQIVTGQQVGVFMDGAKNPHSNVKWVAGANGVLTTATPAYWGNGNVTITAYHPYNAGCNGSPYTFSVKTDQSSAANYLNSDLLWTTTTAAKTNNPVSLTFGHVLSKITVSLTSDNIADLSGATVSICGTKNYGLFNPMSSDLSNLSSEAEIVAGVTVSNAYTASAIILPQQVNSGTKFVKVSHNNKTYHYALSENKNFQRGNSYNFNLKVTAAGLVALSSSITDWNCETISGEMVEDSDNNDVVAGMVVIRNQGLSDALYKLYGDQYSITINADGYAEMLESEVLNITELNLDAYEQDFQGVITTLEGIQYFKNLQDLACRNSELTICDLSQNTKLQTFAAQSEKLTSLDFSNNPDIFALYLNYNHLLSSLNLTGCTKLFALQIFDSNLTSLEIPNKDGLYNLLYGGSPLRFDLYEFSNLGELGCENMELTNLDFIPQAMKNRLTFLSCERNSLQSIDLSEYPNLNYFKCASNQLTTLNLSYLPNVKEIHCYDNYISSLDITGLNRLEQIVCGQQKNNITLELSLTQQQKDNWNSLNQWGNENVELCLTRNN